MAFVNPHRRRELPTKPYTPPRPVQPAVQDRPEPAGMTAAVFVRMYPEQLDKLKAIGRVLGPVKPLEPTDVIRYLIDQADGPRKALAGRGDVHAPALQPAPDGSSEPPEAP
jgi:hypothetical protein